jgi:hypothetical protein
MMMMVMMMMAMMMTMMMATSHIDTHTHIDVVVGVCCSTCIHVVVVHGVCLGHFVDLGCARVCHATAALQTTLPSPCGLAFLPVCFLAFVNTVSRDVADTLPKQLQVVKVVNHK